MPAAVFRLTGKGLADLMFSDLFGDIHMANLDLVQDSVYGAHSREASRSTHLPVLDGVRAISILLVLAGHLLPIGPKYLQLNGAAAALGMSLFFCLSGFLIVTFLLRKPDVVEFLIRRVFRIVPALFMFLLIAMALNVGVRLRSALIDMAFVSNYFYSGLKPGPISHLWSLCVEMQFYMAIAFVVLLGGRRGLWLVPAAALIVTALRVDAHAYININTHLRVDEILTGGCLALFSTDKVRILILSIPNRLIRLGISVTFMLWLASSHPLSGWLNYFRPYLTALLVGSLMFGQVPALQRFLSARPLRYIANISYATYLYHPLMASGLLAGRGTIDAYLVKRPISLLLTWLAAHLSTYYWERPWNEFGRGRFLAWLRG